MPLKISSLCDKRLSISLATIAYVSAERDLFLRWGTTAVRYLTADNRRLLARLAHDLGWRRVKRHARIVTVATLRRWWKDLLRDPRLKLQRGGRKSVDRETIELILEIAKDNSLGNDAWGRRRICGELHSLGISIGSSTVQRILKRNGFPTAPDRGRAWDGPVAIAASDTDTVAIDFTKVTVGYGDTATEHFLLAGIHIGTRKIEILGMTKHPNREWIAQIARNITMADVGFLHRVGAKAVLMDRDTLFTIKFRHILRQSGFATHRTPKKCPWCNAFIERYWQTLKNGIVRKAIWLDDQALRDAVVEFTHVHYLSERPHQSLGNRPPNPSATTCPDTARPVVRLDRLGGLIHVYRRAA